VTVADRWALLAILLALALTAAIPPGAAQRLECDSFKWEQDGVSEADYESGTVALTPTRNYSAVVGIRQTPCTPTKDACGAPSSQVQLRLGARPLFVHVELASTSAPLAPDEPGNLEAVTRATYSVDAQALAQQVFHIELIATCPSGAVIRGNASFHVSGYYAAIATRTDSARDSDGSHWSFLVQNAGNTHLVVEALVNATTPDPAWVLPEPFLLAHPTSEDPDGGDKKIDVRYRGQGVPSQQVVLRPHVWRDATAIGADVPLDLDASTVGGRSAGPTTAVVLASLAAALLVARRIRP
jgi:hypothetical protein